MNTLTKIDIESTPYSILIGARSVEDLKTIHEMEPRVLRAYLLILREIFSSNNEIHEALKYSGHERRNKIMSICTNIIVPGTDDIWEAAINTLIEEHDRLIKSPNTKYIIDKTTGLAILPLNQNTIFIPSDYIGQDGKSHLSQPIINPGISSALGLAIQEKERIKSILAKHHGPAYEHLRNPNSIIRVATDRLREWNIKVDTCDGSIELVEIGREQVDGIFQSPNPSFHRFIVFGEILARKISAMKPTQCEFGQLELKQNAKQRWYQIFVKLVY
jgi:hypothetical protein